MLLRLDIILLQGCKWFSLTAIALFLLPLNVPSQSTSQNSVQSQKKIALVIGNGNYNSSTLANPENDAKAMRVALQSVGFTVMEYENLNQVQMKKAIDDFGVKLRSNEIGLFFYAGHGIQSNGYNYLIPVDAQLLSEQQVEYDCVQADRVLALMEASGTKVNIIILDACRNNPFERSWTRAATGKGLAFMNAPSGTLIAYATSPGNTASDGSGNNGLYTSAILESIKIPNITIIQMFQNVRSIVSQKSSKKQIPWESTSLTGDFYFNIGENVTSEFQKEIPATPLNEISTLDERNYVVDSRDNERYNTIKIGTQVWMKENLKTTKYRNGDLIGTTTPATKDISGETSPKYQWAYGGNENNVATYGRLYTWYAVTDKRNICPTGWHVPTDEELTTLITYLGGAGIAGGKLKESGTSHFPSPNTGATNETGYTALPSGSRSSSSSFGDIGDYGYWWSSTEYSTASAYYRGVYYGYSNVGRNYSFKRSGFSVRCLRD
jgi:uncharacterized protein (TIGR02145 family)